MKLSKLLALVIFVAFSAGQTQGTAGYGEYRETDQTWIIGNPLVRAAFQLDVNGRFRFRFLEDHGSRRIWRGSETYSSSPIRLMLNDVAVNEETVYSLLSYAFDEIDTPAPGNRLTLRLSTESVAGEFVFEADVYDNQPFIRYRSLFRNSGPFPVLVTHADMLSWNFFDRGESYRDFFVAQWKYARASNFEPRETNVTQQGGVEMFTGAYGDHTAWRAIRDSRDYGLVAAWEFNGRARSRVEHAAAERLFKMDSRIVDLNHRVDPGDTFQVPHAFIGVFRGDWDEAGYRTQRFAEAVLAAPMPDPDKFPYVVFDTWGYGTEINEALAMQAAERAAELGVELFILDLGWARNIGDWRPDPDKFPNGLRPLSDYVHRLGMKFGLQLPLLEAAPDSPVIQQHPDWEAVEPNRPLNYFGATALCPSHRPARQWIISETTRVIRQYGVDWITQDGENMVKFCESTTHTHEPGDSNYSNSVDGLDTILRVVKAFTPGVVWENCEDGGSMQTFKMVQQYVTSIVNDSDNALTTRRAVHGATYPFSPRYTNRYMMDEPDSTYHTRSYMFGGPFAIMNRITRWSGGTMNFMKREVALYKSLRGSVRDSKIYHLTGPPDGASNDAISAHDPIQDRSIIFVHSDEDKAGVTFIHPRGLDPTAIYQVGFLELQYSYLASGEQIMRGIPVIVPPWSTEVVSILRK